MKDMAKSVLEPEIESGIVNEAFESFDKTMLITVFNNYCDMNSDSEEESQEMKREFLANWIAEYSKAVIQPDIKRYNKFYNQPQIKHIHEIKGVPAPSTEDIQDVYNKSINGIKKYFNHATR